MKIQYEKALNNISNDLVENAKIEIEVSRKIQACGLVDQTTGKTDFDRLYDMFKDSKKITIFKQKKQSGYDVVALYKNVAMVGIADFMTKKGKEMEESFNVAAEWPVFQTQKLKRKVLYNLFDNPRDNRTDIAYKPRAEIIWSMIEDFLMK